MYFAHDSYLEVTGFTHVTPLGHMTCFMSFDWLQGQALLTRRRQLKDFTL